MLTIALGSQSAVKVRAVNLAVERLKLDAIIVPVKASSLVSEQPFEGETVRGAINRATNATMFVPQADYALAIESGLFYIDGEWQDIAVVFLRARSGGEFVKYSKGVVFPTNAVEEVKRRGDPWTVGKVLVEVGIVSQHDDPHKDLAGKSRADFINEAVYDLFNSVFSD